MYAMVMAGLLFLAFVFFAFAQAASARNGAQSAADAAALAAAQESRDHLHKEFLAALDKGNHWGWLIGNNYISPTACDEAARFADRNDSNVAKCVPVVPKRGYEVEIETRYTMGESIIPGTENKKAKASATAVINPLCTIADGAEGEDLVEFRCKGKDWILDPANLPDLLPEPSDLFVVHLDD